MSAANTLYYGDNLDILRHSIPTASVDLIYLDPPFNSNRDYNVLFREKSGKESPAQIEAFTDTWAWDRSAERTYEALLNDAPANVAQMIAALRQFIGANDMMAYLAMMTARLIELHRVLKPTGSLYLHCDPTASHYLKIVLDTIFGVRNFRNEIIWKRQSAHSDATRKFPNVADVILFYGNSESAFFAPIYADHDPEYLTNFYRFDDHDGRGLYRLSDMTSPNPRPNMMYTWKGFSSPAKGWRFQSSTMAELDEQGRIHYPITKTGEMDTDKRPALKRYLNEQKGSIVTNIWEDILPLHGTETERLGYPTQKPLALLERIIAASSNPGDVVLDPFCGCGTAIVAAQKLGRRWIGIDVTHLAISLMKYRLTESFPGVEFDVKGEPADVGSAAMLAEADRYQFQWWALSLVRAKPQEGKEKKGADRGIDGVITFVDDHTGKLKRCLVQVKSGHVSSATIRDLKGTMEREKAELGILVTLEPDTAPMRKEAAEAGFYHSPGWGRDYPKIQIATIESLLNGAEPAVPYGVMTFGRSERISTEPAISQPSLLPNEEAAARRIKPVKK